jgi:uncharacterized membrane protein
MTDSRDVLRPYQTEQRIESASVIPSAATIAGHPIHPMLIPFPIAFLSGVLVTDLTYIVGGDGFWAEVSFWLLVAGIATAALASVFGAIDYLSNPRIRSLNVARIHAAANLSVVSLAVISLLLRANDHAGGVEPWGVLLSAAIALMLFVSGWMGGEMVYRHRVGITSKPI